MTDRITKMITDKLYSLDAPDESGASRYEREAQARMTLRIGPELAEEFFSVASSTDLNVVNVAELMAAAHKTGKEGRVPRPVLVVYEGPGGTTSSNPPESVYADEVRMLGHEVIRHESGTVEVRVKWEYA